MCGKVPPSPEGVNAVRDKICVADMLGYFTWCGAQEVLHGAMEAGRGRQACMQHARKKINST